MALRALSVLMCPDQPYLDPLQMGTGADCSTALDLHSHSGCQTQPLLCLCLATGPTELDPDLWVGSSIQEDGL